MKTAINLGFGFPELSNPEQLRHIKDAGFDAIFNRCAVEVVILVTDDAFLNFIEGYINPH